MQAQSSDQELRVIRPQSGFQERVLACSADIGIVGGSAGCGKTFVELEEALYHIGVPDFSAVFFRRTTKQIRNPGGLWDEARKLYPFSGGVPFDEPLEYRWESGAKIKMAHLEHESNVLDWQGAQVPLICCEVGTRVRMADGSLMAVELLRMGDIVATLNGPRAISSAYSPRLEPCVRITTSDGLSQVQAASHAVLTPDGWRSYDDMSGEPPLSLTFESKECRCVRISSEPSDSISRFGLQPPDSRSCHQEQLLESSRLQEGHLSSSGIFFCTEQPDLDSCCESSQCERRARGPLPLVRLIAVQHSPILGSEGYGASPTFEPREAPCDQPLSSLVDFQDHCSTSPHHGDELQCCLADIPRPCAQEQDGVEGRNPTHSTSDDLGKVQTDIRFGRSYAHPYTGEVRTARERSQLVPCKLTPCGDRWVVHLSVSGESHYITEAGLVNRNCFDELTHFTSSMFWYMLSRNRSTCGVRPYIRASCNPDADSWVAELIAWWIDQETGYAIPERAGVLRYFARIGDQIVWGDSRTEVMGKCPGVAEADVKSLTFIPGRLDENKILLTVDPGYRGNLMAMTRVERARLLDGNWKVRKSAGSYFRRSDVKILDVAPTDLSAATRRWDLAASEPTEAYPNPDYTCGVKLGRYKDGRFVVLHAEMQRKRANEVRELVKRMAADDGESCSVGVPQDPAQAGKDQAESYVLDLAGFDVYAEKESGDKQTRAEPCAAQWQHQNIDVVKGPWNDAFFAQLEAFPDPKVHDDAVDALSGAFKHLLEGPDGFSYYR